MTPPLTNPLWTGKEKGWAWVICAAAFFCTSISDGVAFGFSAISLALLEEVFFTCDHPIVMTMFCGSLLVACYLIVAPIASSHFSQTIDKWRKYTIVGALMTSAGFTTAAIIYANYIAPVTMRDNLIKFGNEYTTFSGRKSRSNPHASMQVVFICSFSLLGGLGLGILYIIPVTSVGAYFERRRPLVVNLALTGSCLGTAVVPISIGALIFDLDMALQDVLLMMAGCALNGCVFGMLLRPTIQDGSKRVYHFRTKDWFDRLKEIGPMGVRGRNDSEVSIGGKSAQREVVAAARARRLRQYSEAENLSIFPSRVQSRSNSRRSLRTSVSSDTIEKPPPKITVTKGSPNLRKEAVRNSYAKQRSITSKSDTPEELFPLMDDGDTISLTSRASQRLLDTEVHDFEVYFQMDEVGEDTPLGALTPVCGTGTPQEMTTGSSNNSAPPSFPRVLNMGTPPTKRGINGHFVRRQPRSISESAGSHRTLDKDCQMLLPPSTTTSRRVNLQLRRRMMSEGSGSQQRGLDMGVLNRASSRTSVHSVTSTREEREKSARALILATAPHMKKIPQTRKPQRLLRPVRAKKKKSIVGEMRTSLCANSNALYTNPAFLIYLLGHVLGLFSMFIPFFFLPIITASSCMRTKSQDQSADARVAVIHGLMQIVVIGCCSSFGRWLVYFMGEMNDGQPRPIHLTTVSLIVNAGSTFGIYWFIRSVATKLGEEDTSVLPLLYGYSALFGFCLSFFTTNMPPILYDIVGQSCQNSAISHSMLWGALGVVIGPPVAGYFVEENIYADNKAFDLKTAGEGHISLGHEHCNYIRSQDEQFILLGVPGLLAFPRCLGPLAWSLLVTSVALGVSALCFTILNVPGVRTRWFVKETKKVEKPRIHHASS